MFRQSSSAQSSGENQAQPTPATSARPARSSTLPGSLGLILSIGGISILAIALFYILDDLPRAVVAAATASALAAEEQKLQAEGIELLDERFEVDHAGLSTGEDELSRAVVEAGVLRISFSAAGWRSLILTQPLAAFIAQVDCTHLEGRRAGECGILFSAGPPEGTAGEAQYYFYISGSAYGLRAPREEHTYLERNDRSALRPGSRNANTLKVIRTGVEIRLYANGRLVDRILDPHLEAASVGVMAGSYAEHGGVQIDIDNFKVWQLP